MANNKNPNEKQPGENPEGITTIPAIWPEKSRRIRSRLPKTVGSRMSTKKNPPLEAGNDAAN